MNKPRKRWSDLTTDELAAATREFDDPEYDPPAQKPTARQLSRLRRVQQKAASSRLRVTIALERELVDKVDQYALNKGTTFSELVSDALRELVKKRSA